MWHSSSSLSAHLLLLSLHDVHLDTPGQNLVGASLGLAALEELEVASVLVVVGLSGEDELGVGEGDGLVLDVGEGDGDVEGVGALSPLYGSSVGWHCRGRK